jgi:hypothetical protein
MDIIFNCLDSGLGPNGGSRTIVRSANTLRKEGNNVWIFNPKKEPAYTWDEIEVPIIHEHFERIFKADAIIATSYSSVKSTMEFPDRLGKKYHWIRGFESWHHNEKEMIEIFNQPTIKIVNSICMQNKLKEFNIDSKIIRPGYDFYETFPLNIRKSNETLTLGGLYSSGDKRSTKRVNWILKAVREIKEKMRLRLIMFGSENSPHMNDPIDSFISNPSIYVKNSMYNECDIWLAPTCNDSLHMPPAEAMLTECCIVGTDAPMNGMKDYLINAETGIESFNNYESFRDSIIYALLVGEETRLRFGKAGKAKISLIGTREYNMNILINYIDDNM